MNSTPSEYSYSQYLQAKRTVDDRALNVHVQRAALRALPRQRKGAVLELGGGVGTMVDRLLDWGTLGDVDYTLLDSNAESLAEAAHAAPVWARGGRRNHPGGSNAKVCVKTQHARLEDWIEASEEQFDLVIAHAVLDLIDVATIMPRLLRCLAPAGVLWATINFDGDTIFMPRVEADDVVLAAYHRSMDERPVRGRPPGSSTAGREIFMHVRSCGGRIDAAGSSDWVVFPNSDGTYVGNESYFLHHIIRTIEEELSDHPQLASVVAIWGAERHRQVERGELIYVAHQLDFAIRA